MRCGPLGRAPDPRLRRGASAGDPEGVSWETLPQGQLRAVWGSGLQNGLKKVGRGKIHPGLGKEAVGPHCAVAFPFVDLKVFFGCGWDGSDLPRPLPGVLQTHAGRCVPLCRSCWKHVDGRMVIRVSLKHCGAIGSPLRYLSGV